MKVIYLNIFKGCQEENRLHKIIRFVERENPDFLLLSELNGWEKQEYAILKKFKKNTKFSHSYFSQSNSSYHLAILSKQEADSVTRISKNFTHSALKLSFKTFSSQPVSIFLTHLSPFSEDQRLLEIKQILKFMKQEEHVLLFGDLNSLSPLDSYDDLTLLKQLKEQGISKFGIDNLRKEVQEEILAAGYIDLVYKNSNRENIEFSVPTPFNSDPHHLTKLRLDYAFCSPSLSSKVKTAMILRSEETDQLSDHYPLILDFDL